MDQVLSIVQDIKTYCYEYFASDLASAYVWSPSLELLDGGLSGSLLGGLDGSKQVTALFVALILQSGYP